MRGVKCDGGTEARKVRKLKTVQQAEATALVAWLRGFNGLAKHSPEPSHE